MIQYRIHKEIEVPFWFDIENPVYVGSATNIIEYYDMLSQINEENISGYYIVFNGENIHIDRTGTLESYPVGLMDSHVEFITKLILVYGNGR